MDTILIAPAAAVHLEEIPTIELAAASMFAEADLPQNVRYKVTEPADLRTAMQEKRIWVAVVDERKTAGFAMTDIADGQAYLVEVDVLPEYSRKGIGTQLVGAAIAWARSQGLASLWLITFRHVPWNAPFYEKLGFSIVDPAEHGVELASLIEEEGQLGINTDNRVVMRIPC